MNLFTISLLVHNRLEYTQRCVARVRQTVNPDWRLVIADGGSTDNTRPWAEELQAEDPRVHYCDLGGNIGFIRAHNLVLEQATGLYFVVLNNDLDIMDPLWLDKMRECFTQDPRLGVVGLIGACQSFNAAKDNNGTPGGPLEYIEGSCLMIPTHLARQQGLFSTYFRFGYCEDADLSLRLRERGYGIKTVKVAHRHAQAVTYAETKREIDLDGFHGLNHIVLKDRWKFYFKHRHFRYRILVARGGAAGDVLLMTPLLHALRLRYAEAEIRVSTGQVAILDRNPDISGLIAGDALKTTPWDKVIDLNLAYEYQPFMHIIEAYEDVAEQPIEDWRLRIYPTKLHRARALELLKDLDRKKTVVVHPGPTAWAGRNWPQASWEQAARQLRTSGWKVVVVGNKVTMPIDCDLDLRGRTNIHETASVIERAAVFLGLDSLPFHLAQAAKIPAVAIFGCIDPKTRVLPWPFVKAAQAPGVSCLGCHHHLPAPRTDSSCFRSEVFCMTKLAVDRVLDLIPQALEAYAMELETSKIRDYVLERGWCEGRGIDIGCSRDKIRGDALGFDDDPWPEVDLVGNAGGPLPFVDRHFDYVYSSHCLEDMADTAAILREWVRVLRVGGHIVLYVPHPLLYKGTNCDHKHPGFTPEELTEFLGPLGCRTVHTYIDDGPNHYSTLVVAQKEK